MRPLNGSQIVQKSISNRHKVGFWGFNGSLKDFSKESWAPRGGMNPIWPRNPRKTCGKSGQLDPKTEQKSTYKSIIFQLFLRSIYCSIFVDFGRKNGAEMVVKSMINRCQLRHPIFCKNHGFSVGKTIILMVLGFEVGSENQWKRHGKIVDYTECILAPRFNRFRYVLGGQDGAGMDCQI